MLLLLGETVRFNTASQGPCVAICPKQLSANQMKGGALGFCLTQGRLNVAGTDRMILDQHCL